MREREAKKRKDGFVCAWGLNKGVGIVSAPVNLCFDSIFSSTFDL